MYMHSHTSKAYKNDGPIFAFQSLLSCIHRTFWLNSTERRNCWNVWQVNASVRIRCAAVRVIISVSGNQIVVWFSVPNTRLHSQRLQITLGQSTHRQCDVLFSSFFSECMLCLLRFPTQILCTNINEPTRACGTWRVCFSCTQIIQPFFFLFLHERIWRCHNTNLTHCTIIFKIYSNFDALSHDFHWICNVDLTLLN